MMNYRSLTLFLATWSLISSTSTAYLLHNLPDDPLHIGTHLSVYCLFASALAMLGIVGAKKNNATLTTIFANYLFVDVSLSTIGRLATLILFPTLRAELCSATSIHAWLQSQNGSGNLVLADNGLIAQDVAGQCRQVVVVLQALLGILAVGLTFVQVMLAIRVNRYGQELRRLETMVDAKRLVGLTPSFVKMEEKKKYVVLE